MHYGFVPNQPNLNLQFSGYTENPYTFQRYIELLEKFNVHNELPNEGYENKRDCMSAMKSIMTFNGIDPTGVFFGRNNLFTITGKGIVPKVVVVTDIIFEHFNEVYYGGREIYKLFSDLYRLCSKMSTKYLYGYLKATPETEIFVSILKKIFEVWSLNKVNGVSASGEFYSPETLLGFNEDGQCKLWDVIDQASQLELYIASEVVKNNLLFNTDAIAVRDFYNFDVR